jgi:hypothetical protein
LHGWFGNKLNIMTPTDIEIKKQEAEALRERIANLPDHQAQERVTLRIKYYKLQLELEKFANQQFRNKLK